MARLLGDMMAACVIRDYAIFGAVAQMRYTAPVATLDVDVLVALPESAGIGLLAPIYSFCAEKGYLPEGEAIRVGAWPVQFIPAFSDLTREAMERAETVDYEGVPLRVVPADYLAVIGLGAGRAKDLARVLALIESRSVTPDAVADLAGRHGLSGAWERFRSRFLGD